MCSICVHAQTLNKYSDAKNTFKYKITNEYIWTNQIFVSVLVTCIGLITCTWLITCTCILYKYYIVMSDRHNAIAILELLNYVMI